MGFQGHGKNVIEKRIIFAAGTAALALANADVAAGRADQVMNLTGVTSAQYSYTPPAGWVWQSFASYSKALDDGSGTSQPAVDITYAPPFWGGTLVEEPQGNFTFGANAGIYGTTVYGPLTDGVTPMTITVSLGTPFTTGLAYVVVTLYQR